MNGKIVFIKMENELKINKLWFDDNKIFIQTKDGKEFWQSLLWYHRLMNATPEQQNRYYFSYSGIHFPEVDEDISFESFLRNKPEPTGISRIFLTHPELNISAVARRIGIQQSLLASYISEIKNAIKEIGEELMAVELYFYLTIKPFFQLYSN
jgi:hypothetical protein